MSAVLAVALGAALGAPMRYLVDLFVTGLSARTRGRDVPWGLLVVNVLGSSVAGLLVGRLGTQDGIWQQLLVVGWCGAFTTFSGLAWQLHRLREERRGMFWTALVLIPGLSILGFLAGWSLAR